LIAVYDFHDFRPIASTLPRCKLVPWKNDSATPCPLFPVHSRRSQNPSGKLVEFALVKAPRLCAARASFTIWSDQHGFIMEASHHPLDVCRLKASKYR
jgi:hypothetical protein